MARKIRSAAAIRGICVCAARENDSPGLTAGRRARARTVQLDPENTNALRPEYVARPAEHSAICHYSEVSCRGSRTNRAENNEQDCQAAHAEITLAFPQLTQPADRAGSTRTRETERGENKQCSVDHDSTERAEQLLQSIFRKIVCFGNYIFACATAQCIGPFAFVGGDGCVIWRKNKTTVIAVSLGPRLN